MTKEVEWLRHGALWQRWSPVTRVRFRGVRVHVKRDDVFHLAGNKMRKLQWFVAQDAAFFQSVWLPRSISTTLMRT